MSFSSSTLITIHAPVKKVWDALTVPVQVKQYFFGTNLDTDWKVGSQIYFRGEYQGKTYEDKGHVLEFSPEKSLSFDYWSGFSGLEDKPENYAIIRYALTETEGNTTVTVSQSNVDTQERADHSAKNWKMVLEGLRKFVESQ
jgi:uncharacterized protein YndB with AHSA1/START domain